MKIDRENNLRIQEKKKEKDVRGGFPEEVS